MIPGKPRGDLSGGSRGSLAGPPRAVHADAPPRRGPSRFAFATSVILGLCVIAAGGLVLAVVARMEEEARDRPAASAPEVAPRVVAPEAVAPTVDPRAGARPRSINETLEQAEAISREAEIRLEQTHREVEAAMREAKRAAAEAEAQGR